MRTFLLHSTIESLVESCPAESYIRGHLIWNLWNWPEGSQNTEITQIRFINFILNDHSRKILYIIDCCL